MADSSMFDVSDAESDFAPAPVSHPHLRIIKMRVEIQNASINTQQKVTKTKAAPKKAAASKAATKKATTTKAPAKAKSTVPKKRAKADSEDEQSEPDLAFDDESLLGDTPPKAKKAKITSSTKNPAKSPHGKPLGQIVNEAMALDGTGDDKPKKAKRNSEVYQQLSPVEHILRRPDTYIGSIERTDVKMWVFNDTTKLMEFRDISFVPGLYKILDEILVNAADNRQNDKNMDEMRVTIDREKGEISVYNNGKGIPIEIHSKKGIYIPEMIFGNLLTGSNYNDDEAKVTGGRNGYGAKLTNIYSTKFTIETADSKQKKRYKQTWTDNMSKMGKATITDQKGEDYTKVTFYPDFARFNMPEGMDDDFIALAMRRVYDMAGTCKGVKVKLNGSRLQCGNFKKYIELYTKGIKNERGEEAANDHNEIITDSPDPRWEIGFAVSDGSFQQVSFVNSVATTSGGTHVSYIADQVCNKLLEVMKKKNKAGTALKIGQVRNHIFIFVNALIVNPAFTSQTKEQLTTKPSKFGSKCEVSEDFFKKICKTQVINNIMAFAQQKADQILKKSDGNKRSRMTNPKLTDANWAGTKNGDQCTLILTEGDSAKGLAMAGRAVVGADEFGVFPLRGKLLNVRDASVDQIAKNAEIQNIKTFLGLQHKKVYTDKKGLRYGRLMIMTDQDHDGSHIKGLLINFLQVQFPSLLTIPDFLVEFITPIVKVYKGDPKNPSKSKSFFTMPEYEAWKEAHKHERGWEHKYYKGLGTSTTEDAQKYFNDLDTHHKEFDTMKEEEVQLIDLAFSKKKADERKEWLRQFKPGTFLDHSTKKITYTDFINRELILFSMADNIRSIPSVVDGFKPGQRKIMWVAFKRNIKKDVKVIELAGQVMGMTAYAHGEASLQQTIVGLAQTFVGSNNINCLEPSGNFGSRLMGGSDAASARYIYTRLSPFARKLFHAADEPLLTYNTDDDRKMEPEVYCPVVPMILINGADGIGTGWSTSIPNYSPEDIVANLKRRMNGEEMLPMQPWFRGFKGEVTAMGPDRYKFSGVVKQTGDTEVEITELPIRTWTQDFKDKLEEVIKAEKVPSYIKDYKDYNTHKDVHFIITMTDEKHMKNANEEGLEERFKLSKSIATSNMVAFDPQGRIHRYANVEEIMDEYYNFRLDLYAKRKAHLLAEMGRDLDRLSNQARFVQMIIDGKLVISKKKKAVLVAELKKQGFKSFTKVEEAAEAGETEPAMQDEDDDADVELAASAYDYLLGMPLWSLTQERVEKLRKQIGDKEMEVDALIKLSKEDLWRRDLDEFLAEWKFQLEDERTRQRTIKGGRRVSKKFATSANRGGIKKKKGLGDLSDSDDDFQVSKPKKTVATKTAPPKAAAKPKQSTLMPYVAPLPKNPYNVLEAMMKKSKKSANTDGASDELDFPSEDDDPLKVSKPSKPVKEQSVEPKPAKKAAKSKPAIQVKEDSDVEEIVRKSTDRAAAAKSKYTIDSDSDDNGDDLLGDVGAMVQGLTSSIGDTDTRTLFAASKARPGSSSGYKVPSRTASKPSPVDISDDETDYNMLAPQSSPRRSILVTNKDKSDHDFDDSDEDPLPAVKPKAKPAAPKPAKAAPKEKKAAPAKKPAVKKVQPQSPAAKAYAKRLAKKQIIDDDSDDVMDVDAIADEMLDDSDADVRPAKEVARPARRAAAAKPKKTYDFDDDEEDDFGGNSDESEEASFEDDDD
jgi:DNA topoisomerase-2